MRRRGPTCDDCVVRYYPVRRRGLPVTTVLLDINQGDVDGLPVTTVLLGINQ